MNKPHRAAGVPLIAGLSEIAARYDVVLSDIWGVVHNGRESFAAATDALARFRRGGGDGGSHHQRAAAEPRRFAPNSMNSRFRREAYDAIVTSGDVTIGADRGARIGAGSSYRTAAGPQPVRRPRRAPPARRAAAGRARRGRICALHRPVRRRASRCPATTTRRFGAMLARRLPLICANPDLVVQRGEELIYCAGALAQRYEEMGGDGDLCRQAPSADLRRRR